VEVRCLLIPFTETPQGILIFVHVQPRARNYRLTATQKEITMWITSAPEKNNANREVIVRIAEICGIATSQVSIIRGAHTRDKIVEVKGVKLPVVLQSFGLVSHQEGAES